MTIQYMRRLEHAADYGTITEHTAKYNWLCASDSRFESDYTITQYGWYHSILPIPYVSSIFGINPLVSLLCRQLSIKQDKKSPLHYLIEADYSSAPLSQTEKNQQPDPLDRPSTYKWKTNKYNKAIYKDVNGLAIMNSAGEYFDPPVEMELWRWIVIVTTNVPAVPVYMMDYAEGGPINIDPFTIQGVEVEPQQARLAGIDISELQTATVDDGNGGTFEREYYIYTYEMEFRAETWQLALLDQGMRQIDPNDDTKRIAIKDDAVPQREVKKPWPLDGEGARLDDPTPENAQYILFNTIKTANFSDNLPGLNF